MLRNLTWTGDVNHIMMKSSANQHKKRGAKFLTSAVLLTFLFLSRLALSEGTGQTPYPGPDLHAIPGRIEAENYDSDGENISFHDSDITNEGGEYRTDGVDIEVCSEGDYNVGWIANGEWLEYSVNVASTGNYDIEARVSSDIGGGDFHIEFNDTDVTGTVSFSATGGWQTYTSVFVNDVSLTSGDYIMRISMDADYWNITWLDFTYTGVDTTPPANPTGLTAAAGNGVVVLDWEDNGEGDLDGYNVYRSTTSGGGYSQINGSLLSDSNYTDNSVTNDTTYYYVVTAIDTSSNESGYSNEDSATPTEYGYCGDGMCNPEENCWICEADCGACVDDPIWQADARCFLDGPPGAFDDISVKDPTIVYYGGKWHLFYTGRDVGVGGNFQMGYASAPTIAELNNATRYFLRDVLNGGTYFCAPQVFWFEEKGLWYLIYQSGLGPTFSTNTDISDPNGWTAGESMNFSGGVVDYWCISDGTYVYNFYSPLGTTILRRRTTVEDFPYNWSAASTVATNTFEAPHIYKNIADGKYYMMVEDVSRHFELWTASDLGGTWTKLQENWAHGDQLVFNADHWTDQVSHGEIIRAGVDEKLEINSINRCEILIQGVVDGSYGDYGNIPYDLGIIRRQCPAAGPADLNLDCGVDFGDFAVLAWQWLQPPGVPSADIAPPGGDGIVDMNDLGLLVDSWLGGK